MPTQLINYSRKDIEEIVDKRCKKLEEQFYIELNKMRAGIIDLDDIVKVINRNKK